MISYEKLWFYLVNPTFFNENVYIYLKNQTFTKQNATFLPEIIDLLNKMLDFDVERYVSNVFDVGFVSQSGGMFWSEDWMPEATLREHRPKSRKMY